MRLSSDGDTAFLSPPPSVFDVGRPAVLLLPVVGWAEVNAAANPPVAVVPERLGAVDEDAVFTCGAVEGRCCVFVVLEDGVVSVAVAVDPSDSFHSPSDCMEERVTRRDKRRWQGW